MSKWKKVKLFSNCNERKLIYINRKKVKVFSNCNERKLIYMYTSIQFAINTYLTESYATDFMFISLNRKISCDCLWLHL